MRRSRVIAGATVLAIVGAVAPIAAMAYASWALALSAEQARLGLFAARAIVRAEMSFAEARTTLEAIAASAVEPCSAVHIDQMRRLAINSRVVEEMGYFEDGVLKCTSWGPTLVKVEQSAGDYVTPDGTEVTVRMLPMVSRGKPMMALHHGQYNVLIDPVRLVDVVVDPGIQLAIATDAGIVLGELYQPDPALIKSLIAEPRSGMDGDSLFAVVEDAGWIAVATERGDGVLGGLQRQQRILIPVGAFMAILIVGMIVWSARKRLSPMGELSIAVRKREFIVHYQPIVELKTGKCVGAEALVRWRKPDGSLVRPDLFIPLAEESGLIIPITDQVIANIVADLNALLVTDRALHIAINLSARDIKTGRILDAIRTALEHTGIRPQQIWLEATETGFTDIESARATIIKARQLGHTVAIDDFGTGYSSLQYLQGLPLDALKIDKSFIDTIGLNTATSSVTAHIIDMAQSLNLAIVAEGVETEAQAAYLRAHKVDFGQGWLFAKPLPAMDFIAFHRRSREQFGAGPTLLKRAAA